MTALQRTTDQPVVVVPRAWIGSNETEVDDMLRSVDFSILWFSLAAFFASMAVYLSTEPAWLLAEPAAGHANVYRTFLAAAQGYIGTAGVVSLALIGSVMSLQLFSRLRWPLIDA